MSRPPHAFKTTLGAVAAGLARGLPQLGAGGAEVAPEMGVLVGLGIGTGVVV